MFFSVLLFSLSLFSSTLSPNTTRKKCASLSDLPPYIRAVPICAQATSQTSPHDSLHSLHCLNGIVQSQQCRQEGIDGSPPACNKSHSTLHLLPQPSMSPLSRSGISRRQTQVGKSDSTHPPDKKATTSDSTVTSQLNLLKRRRTFLTRCCISACKT